MILVYVLDEPIKMNTHTHMVVQFVVQFTYKLHHKLHMV